MEKESSKRKEDKTDKREDKTDKREGKRRDKSVEVKGQIKPGAENGEYESKVYRLGDPNIKSRLEKDIAELEKQRRRDRLTKAEAQILDSQIWLLKDALKQKKIRLGVKK